MMRRVVMDTNVAVSAILTPSGNAAKIVDMIADEQLQICYSSDILDEYVEVLSRPRFNFCAEDQENFIAGIKQSGLLCSPAKSEMPFIDNTDRVFFDVAKSCKAILITGNIRHFPSEPFVMTPSDFLESIRGNER